MFQVAQQAILLMSAEIVYRALASTAQATSVYHEDNVPSLDNDIDLQQVYRPLPATEHLLL
jgi:hypothetical protein